MGLYQPTSGSIKVGEKDLKTIKPRIWRKHIGAVMQEGYIFSDTVKNNITANTNTIDANESRLEESIECVNLQGYIQSLPLKLLTKIGEEGVGLSQGQKQRILLARALYKDPKFYVLDEATNSLDSKNESLIINNLYKYFKNKTVIIAAHRLSTIKNADNIIVLNNGQIIEQGSHEHLMNSKGMYYELFKAQTAI